MITRETIENIRNLLNREITKIIDLDNISHISILCFPDYLRITFYNILYNKQECGDRDNRAIRVELYTIKDYIRDIIPLYQFYQLYRLYDVLRIYEKENEKVAMILRELSTLFYISETFYKLWIYYANRGYYIDSIDLSRVKRTNKLLVQCKMIWYRLYDELSGRL
ncbi:MAG: hypothetical protein DRI92_04140 [Aquificota bacterium]|nr:MAG: hypothetical protein DRI92_04140 [Aquificota bacterium]